MLSELTRKDSLQLREGIICPEAVKTEASPCFRGTFRDERAHPLPESVGIKPDPTGLGLDEGEGEGIKDPRGAKPDILVPTRGDGGFEFLFPGLPRPTADPVGRNHHILVGKIRPRIDLHPVPDGNAEIPGAPGEDLHQLASGNAVPRVPRATRRASARNLDNGIEPAEGVIDDLTRGDRITLHQIGNEVLPVGDAPPVGRPLGVPFVDRDVMARIPVLHQDREIESRRAGPYAGDLHGSISSRDGPLAPEGKRPGDLGCGRGAPRHHPAGWVIGVHHRGIGGDQLAIDDTESDTEFHFAPAIGIPAYPPVRDFIIPSVAGHPY